MKQVAKEWTCIACGWVAFGITRTEAIASVTAFNAYFDALSAKQQQELYGGRRSSIQSYERCFFCGGPHTNFRAAKPGDAPTGVTLQPIIVEDNT